MIKKFIEYVFKLLKQDYFLLESILAPNQILISYIQCKKSILQAIKHTKRGNISKNFHLCICPLSIKTTFAKKFHPE